MVGLAGHRWCCSRFHDRFFGREQLPKCTKSLSHRSDCPFVRHHARLFNRRGMLCVREVGAFNCFYYLDYTFSNR